MGQSIEAQRQNWNAWNTCREETIGEVSKDQQVWIEKRLQGRSGLKILDAGCGAGWMSRSLLRYGSVLGTDLADEVVSRAAARVPGATFVAGDFMQLDLGHDFDLLVCLEVLSHVEDQRAFVDKLASHLRPGGMLFLATQNAPVLRRVSWIEEPPPGHLRRWVDRNELSSLLNPRFDVIELATITPAGDRGLWRWINSNKLGALGGAAWKRLRERFGIGWTLMVQAQKRT